jgi:hypothetical protein
MLYMLYKEVVTEKECFDVATLLFRLVLWRPFPLFLSPLPCHTLACTLTLSSKGKISYFFSTYFPS